MQNILGVATFALLLCYSAAVTEKEFEHGVEVGLRAFDAMCWYESTLNVDKHKLLEWQDCMNVLQFVSEVMAVYLKPHPPESKIKWLIFWFSHDQGPLEKLPNYYKDECNKYAEDAYIKPAVDEGKALNDGGKDYPYKALSHCLVHRVRKDGGNKAIDTWIRERLQTGKYWKTTMKSRHNFLRSQHNSVPLTLSKELSKGAHEWALNISKECNLYHAPESVLNADSSHPLGENLGVGTMIHFGEPAIFGLIMTNEWYNEIKDYCYPDEFISETESKPPGCSLSGSKRTGHFTQVVWNRTAKVGFGIACNAECPPDGLCFVVARYTPRGNLVGVANAFRDNVQRLTSV